MLGSGGILGKPCGLPAPQDIFDRNIVAQINLGSEYKISRGKFPRLIFSCPVPSGLPHRSHCVPMNMNRCGYRVLLELLGRFELPTSSLPILPRLFFPALLCFVLKPETLAAQVFQAFLFCIFIFPVLRSRMGFLMPVWVLYGFCSVQSAAIF